MTLGGAPEVEVAAQIKVYGAEDPRLIGMGPVMVMYWALTVG